MSRINSTIGEMSSEIEQVVTKLLRTTKTLLDALNHWSAQHTSVAEIYEIHDILEKQFFLVSQAFEETNISMSDLQWIPRKLRDSISVAMGEQPSQYALDQHLPRIREVIVYLLQGLKIKQSQLREKEPRASIRPSNNTDSWSQVPPAALNRGVSSSSNTARMMYPSQSPPMPPMSPPRMSDYESWSGGMPRPSIPINDLSTRIRQPYSPPPPSHGIPMMPPPSRSTSSSRAPPPPPPPAPPVATYPSPFDENDPGTASAFAALKRHDDLARSSSVRRGSVYRHGDLANRDSPPVPLLRKKHTLSHAAAEEVLDVKKVLELFLQIGKQVKKTSYAGELSIPALNMLFVEKFSYTSRQYDFPTIYIRDPTTGVSYELTNLAEVKDRSVLSLNIDDQEEKKENYKELIAEVSGMIYKELRESNQSVTDQVDQIKKRLDASNDAMVQKITQQILTELKKETAPPAEEPKESAVEVKIDNAKIMQQSVEIDRLKRDIAVMRQLERESKEEIERMVQEIKKKASALVQAKENDTQTSAARISLEEGKNTLLSKSEKITSRLEELQDTIDQIKLDVTQRKCRPSNIQMTHCEKERKELSESIEEFGAYIAQVKPSWKKTWEYELQTIVKEQKTLKDQEYLLTDIKDDLDALSEVFEQLGKIYAYQNSSKSAVREFRIAPAEEGFEGMSSVLKQVATIDVDHDRRLIAMEKSEKMRQRELANKTDDFEQELSTFVDTKKLKKTGGALEIDRLRKQKDEEMLKQMYAAKAAANKPLVLEDEIEAEPAPVENE